MNALVDCELIFCFFILRNFWFPTVVLSCFLSLGIIFSWPSVGDWLSGLSLVNFMNAFRKSTKVLNLTVLQRIDPHVEEILITAAHVTFYEFNIELNQWSRKDVEGSLFVVKRNTQPRFQFIVMNRRNAENLVEDILGDFEYEIQPPYLLYRNAAQEVNGIWFYNQQECEAVAALFQRILSAFSKVPPKSSLSAAKRCAMGNCYSLLKDHETTMKNFLHAVQLDSRFAYAHTLCGHEFRSCVQYLFWNKATLP
ncbi:mRNA-decapping enzyme-like protein isoform X5 [Asparagus officinalis]|uniref:mRNA-decapping enzyme-like protein isoform X5 n=2 Tax=Asparagus officinalis TaxID=4686 RepID=UPI00098DEE47|nr:mRNA-decapping enzyme-like protein isoform X5 [Asparagus officinalis]